MINMFLIEVGYDILKIGFNQIYYLNNWLFKNDKKLLENKENIELIINEKHKENEYVFT